MKFVIALRAGKAPTVVAQALGTKPVVGVYEFGVTLNVVRNLAN